MKITEQEVEHVALMSRLDLTADEKATYTQSLNAILDYLDMLNKLDTTGVEPAAHVLPLKNVYREDKLQPGLDKEQALANAPEEEAGAFKVPRIV
ncbi:Asp-tRNA(Asn)/Glu-tRNA(Gln) amidotransferase subunit GatC [Desulfallas thermosapovorans]|uniref:Aspartyl/glutamyl-tRNA(Asn/Gln) amidotransferase subunit C n=1 Tax=Desulfallas thermosapovorans DSM 6562 TaxID=1121431 RepID=A0A5S4ZV58_9FIRM|nr:Asp-tRNA(Asn)/Glu-tRNA(Gln) amidotransferase subunit GatC [Desulfallas thermosapovorans]TYO96871.1 aspartyl/glutamyl-tRNA(Asn/Gln) amidotransferase subunit C [Desulfallas thermosapovorans DSM 6562]